MLPTMQARSVSFEAAPWQFEPKLVCVCVRVCLCLCACVPVLVPGVCNLGMLPRHKTGWLLA